MKKADSLPSVDGRSFITYDKIKSELIKKVVKNIVKEISCCFSINFT